MANKQFNIGKQSLGQGAFGHVYRGTMMHKNQEIDVAIKRVTNDGDIFEDIKKECDLLNAVQGHRNIIKLLGLEKDENFIYVIMELGDRGDLDHFLMSGEPSLEDKVSIMHGTASAVAYMHNLPAPIIHMDIKPGNIIIMKTPSGVVAKVCDFGFARMFKPKFGVQYMSTKTGATSWYRAPELFAYDRKKYDASIDTFALGLVYLVVINFNDEDKSLDPNPTQLRKGALLQYGQHMNLAKQKAEKMPELFTLSANDIWPMAELKSVVTQMTSFHSKDRIKIEDVEVVLRCIEQKTTTASSITVLKSENENQSQLLVIKREEIANLSQEIDALKLQLRTQDEEMLQKDHKSEIKAAEKDQRIQMLVSEVVSKAMTLHFQTSSITRLRKENEDKTHLLAIIGKEIATLSEECDHTSKENDALKLQLRKQDEEMQQKDRIIHESEVKAAEKDVRIRMLESDVASKAMALQSNTSANTAFQMSKEKEVVASQSQLSDIHVLLNKKVIKIKNLESQLSTRPKSVDQESPLSTRPKSVDQESPLSTRPKSVDQESPLSTRPKSVDQESPLSTRPKSVDQESPLSTRPKSVDQESPLSTRPKSVDQESPLSTRPKSVDQESPLSTRPKSVDQESSLSTRPKSVDQESPLSTRPKSVDQKSPLSTRPKSVDQESLLSTRPKSVDQKSPLSTRPKSVDQESNTCKENVFEKEATSGKKKSGQAECHDKPTSIRSFRHTSVHLQSLVQKRSRFSSSLVKVNLKLVKKIKIKNICQRMCFVNSSIYCPMPDDNSMSVYSLEGNLIKHISLETITSPRALHPLSESRLVLAAESGLYEVDYEGRVMCQIMEGDFRDVHISGHLMAAIEKGYRIHILSTTAPYPQSAVFSVGHTQALTVLLSEDASTVCVSDEAGHHITTYSLSGRLMSQAGGCRREQPGELRCPYLCATDSSGQVLICDMWNNRLQLLSAGGEWAVLSGEQVKWPADAFIHNNNIYVMYGIGHGQISVFKIV